MGKVLIDESNLQAIADSIRAKNGTQETYLPSEMSTAIDNISGGGGVPDWSQIGYDGIPDDIIDSFNYSKDIHDNWDPSITNLASKFSNDTDLVWMPLVDTSNATTINNMFYHCTAMVCIALLDFSNVTNFGGAFNLCVKLKNIPYFDMTKAQTASGMFSGCSNLREIPLLNTASVTNMNNMFSNCNLLYNVPVLDTSSVTTMSGMFTSCTSLTSESLNNILKMCTDSAVRTTTNKKLSKIGLDQDQRTACKRLSNYAAFIAAGWSAD